MSTPDQLLAVALHGTAFRYATERRNLADSIADSRDRQWPGRCHAQEAGLIAGSWYASPATHVGHELIAAGMLILAAGRGKPLDYGELQRWTLPARSGGRRFSLAKGRGCAIRTARDCEMVSGRISGWFLNLRSGLWLSARVMGI
jgi:hypothetical protein